MKNKKTLNSFIVYCELHPEERFWQALRNWAGFSFIYDSNVPRANIELPAEANAYLEDTFYYEK
jgi:hypothetical protein